MSKIQATIRDIKEFYTLTSLLEQFDEIIKFQCSPDGIMIQSMGNGQTCIIKTTLNKDYFDNYECDGKMDISMTMAVLNSILKKAKKGEQITISYSSENSNGEIINFKFGLGLSFDMKLVDLDKEDLDIPDLEYNFSTMLNPHVLKDWNTNIVDMTKGSVLFSFKCDNPDGMDIEEDIMTLKSDGESFSVTKDENLIFNIKSTPGKVSLGYKSMKIVTSLANFNKDVCMCFQNKMPVEFSFEISDYASIECWFAPMMDDEDL